MEPQLQPPKRWYQKLRKSTKYGLTAGGFLVLAWVSWNVAYLSTRPVIAGNAVAAGLFSSLCVFGFGLAFGIFRDMKQ